MSSSPPPPIHTTNVPAPLLQLAVVLAEADKMKQMNQFKSAVDKSKETACEPNGDGSAVTGEHCTQRVSAVSNALGAWAPQYWADTAGVEFKFFSGDIHKIYDFQTLEYGYASDLGIDVDSDLVAAVVGTQSEAVTAARNMNLLRTSIDGWTDVSATVSVNVGWKVSLVFVVAPVFFVPRPTPLLILYSFSFL